MSKKIATHNGKFHADDVFAVATLLHVYPDSEILRTRDEQVMASADVVVDVGKIYDPKILRFDHHQPGGAGMRPNGIPYASFGLVWKEYGAEVAGIEEAAIIEEKLVMSIDAIDNGISVSDTMFEGVRVYDISDYLHSYLIGSDMSEEETLKIFIQLVQLAKDLISREVEKAKRIIEDGKQVEEIYNLATDKRLIVLDKDLSWSKILMAKPEPLIVVTPRPNTPNWDAKTVRKSASSFETRAYFPQTWAGKSGDELAKISKVKDAIFCHNARFLAVAGSKEGAIALAQIALNA